MAIVDAAFGAANAIGTHMEMQCFVPVALFLGKEDETATAVTALAFKIEIMRDGNQRAQLTVGIGGDRGFGNALARTRTPTKVDSKRAIFNGMQPRKPRAASISRMSDEIGVEVSVAVH